MALRVQVAMRKLFPKQFQMSERSHRKWNVCKETNDRSLLGLSNAEQHPFYGQLLPLGDMHEAQSQMGKLLGLDTRCFSLKGMKQCWFQESYNQKAGRQ